MHRGICTFFLAIFAFPALASAQLAFDSKLVTYDADPGDETYEAKFSFVNDKAGVVKITKVDSSCGCLKAVSDKDVFQPGEKGVITGVFSIGGRTGTYEKSISVTTQSDEANELTQELRVRVTMPVVMELTPKQQIWTVGEELKPKSYILENKLDKPIHVTEVATSREGFECKVHEIEKGKKYRIELTPGKTDTPVMGIVRVQTDCEYARYQRQLAFFSVKRASN